MRALGQMLTGATHAGIASERYACSAAPQARATVTTKRKKALSPQMYIDRAASAQAIKPGSPHRPGGSNRQQSKRAVIAHDDGFMPTK